MYRLQSDISWTIRGRGLYRTQNGVNSIQNKTYTITMHTPRCCCATISPVLVLVQHLKPPKEDREMAETTWNHISWIWYDWTWVRVRYLIKFWWSRTNSDQKLQAPRKHLDQLCTTRTCPWFLFRIRGFKQRFCMVLFCKSYNPTLDDDPTWPCWARILNSLETSSVFRPRIRKVHQKPEQCITMDHRFPVHRADHDAIIHFVVL
jgi:hypothetical protein